MRVIVFDIGGTLMKYKNMPLSWLDFYKEGFRNVCNKFCLKTTHKMIAFDISKVK